MKVTRGWVKQKLGWIVAIKDFGNNQQALLSRIITDVKEVLATMERREESDGSDRSGQSEKTGKNVILQHGGYRNLRSFKVAEIIYDATVVFCDRFVDKRSRTHDQMVQAARSGRQNIAEGSEASATSSKTELKLTNVAKASLEELLLDYEDFLRQRNLRKWEKDSAESLAVRNFYKRKSDQSDRSDSSDRSDKRDPYGIFGSSAEVFANTVICLINQACYLLRKQVSEQGRVFVEKGGFTERLYKTRMQNRKM